MANILSGKTAVVTGGEGGIGAAICQRFAAEGAQVVSADLRKNGDDKTGVEFREYDVTSETHAQELFQNLQAQWGALDILVNAAGIEIEQTIEETSLEDWNRIFEHAV